MTAGPTMPTLLLDNDNHDLCLDANGSIAVARPPYATAQSVSCAIRTVLGECYYDQTLGVPYFGNILGKNPPLTYVISQMEAAALSVPGVVSATCTIASIKGRAVTGQVEFTDSGGNTQTISLGLPYPSSISLGTRTLVTGADVSITTESGQVITT